MSTLLERERELTEIEALVGETRAGSGRLMVIEARAGLGKTRLLQAAREAGAEAGLRVLSARATELERDFPFALVRQLFAPHLAAMADPERDALLEGASAAARGALGLAHDGSDAEPAGDTFSVLYGLYWLTAALAERHPLLLAIDDAHWADAASLDFLGFLLPRLEELPVLLVIACRPGEAGAERSLGQIATDATARRLEPRALSSSAAAELLAAELGAQPELAFTETCHEVSGGNPFYLCELARTLTAHGISPSPEHAQAVRELAPERVTRTVLLRLARLPQRARALAQALAVIGDDSDHRLVATLAGLDADASVTAADALRGAAILDAGAALRFIHPLARNAIYADLPAGERAVTHARAAALLRSHGAHAEQIAAQLLASDAHGDSETVETLLKAAQRALADGAPRSAIAYLLRAFREPPAPERVIAVLSPLITACIRAADDSVYATIEADVLAELDRNPELLRSWARELAPWMALSGRLDRATALLERAIEAATGAGDIDHAVQLEAQLIIFIQLPAIAARARLAPYGDGIEPDSAGGRLVSALGAMWSLSAGSRTEAIELARRALHDGKIFAEHPELLSPGQAVLVLIVADELDDAERSAERALAIAQRRGAILGLSGAWYLRGCLALTRGDLAAAEADARQAIRAMRLPGLLPATPPVIALLVEILIERGELQTAEAELDASGMTGVIPDVVWFAPLLLARGRLRLAQGRPKQAAEDLVELHRNTARWEISGTPLMQADAYAARALSAIGDGDQARELAEAALGHARRWGAPTGIARALRALGLTIGGSAGLELLQEAVTVLEDSPARLERAHALADLGAALRRANRRAQAREPLREALELARRCGAAGLAKRAHEELSASGEKVRRHAPIGVDSLTPSERRVAEMAATGMTNRQIAQTLFLTVKTIETHLGAAYDKLGIHSRGQLADALRTHLGQPPAG